MLPEHVSQPALPPCRARLCRRRLFRPLIANAAIAANAANMPFTMALHCIVFTIALYCIHYCIHIVYQSSSRLAMPTMDPNELKKCIAELVKMEKDWIPAGRGQFHPRTRAIPIWTGPSPALRLSRYSAPSPPPPPLSLSPT